MKKTVTILLFLLGLQVYAQIVGGEYFFNNDVGVGKATKFTVVAAESIMHTMTIPASTLAPGFHQLYIRVKDSQNAWSHYQGRMFYIMETPTALSTQLTVAEWFIDTDPGVGKAVAINISAGASVNTTIAIPQQLSAGFHHLYIRVKNNQNHWSHYQGRMFYIMETPTALSTQLTAAEWFVNTDPGVGKATAINIIAGQNVNATIAIPQNLAAGFHNLFIRVKDNRNQWSHYQARMFYIMEASIPVNTQIVRAEWFIDTDPGLGLATSIDIVPGAEVSTTISIPQHVASGVHNLFIRVLNSEGKWSHYAGGEFKVNVVGVHQVVDDCQCVVSIYPNPTSDNVSISVKNTQLEELTLTDLNGKILSKYIVSGDFFVLPIKHLNSGLYFITIKTQNATITKQFVKD